MDEPLLEFVYRQNIEHLRALLASAPDEERRKLYAALLAREERQRFRELLEAKPP